MGNQQNFSQNPVDVVKANNNQMLVSRCARVCLGKMKLELFKKIEFWHTWSNLEVAAFIWEHPLINKMVRDKAREIAVKEWTKFENTDPTPCYYRDRAVISNKNFWDSDNPNCLWDDRLWMGCSYLMLYSEFKIKKYKQVADGLMNLILNTNQNPRQGTAKYEGLFWKGKEGYRNTVTNTLLMAFAGRFLVLDQDSVMLDILKSQYDLLFCQGKFIENPGLLVFPDGPGPDGIWTYNQAMVIEGLAYLTVFDSEKTDIYLKQIARVVNGSIKEFKSVVSPKLIMREHESNPNSTIFRSYFFRHLCMLKRVLNIKAGLWEKCLELTPLFKIFMLDNFQAMCKFESANPGFRWDYDNSQVDYFNPFNLFYVLAAGYELFSIQEVIADGIWFKCNSKFQIAIKGKITEINLLTYKANEQTGMYFNDRVFRLYGGINNIDELLGEKFCVPQNNRNILGLLVAYEGGARILHTLVHIEMADSKFAIIPNVDPQELINNCGTRIRVGEQNWALYNCRETNNKIKILGHKGGPLVIDFY